MENNRIKFSYAVRAAAIAITVVCLSICAYALACRNAALADTLASDNAVELIEYDGEIENIFTHELVYDTDKAFAASNSLRYCFDRDHMTALEFNRLLDSLYSRGYVLVKQDDVSKGEKPTVPRGKKPLVMSFDDMTYDSTGRGCIDKLVLRDGEIFDYVRGGSPEYTRERENITLLESFIEKHPDFSYNGGRATLCVNGYNGILGYRITPSCKVSEEYMSSERSAATELVNALKSRGYSFASHTYYHKYFNSMSAVEIEKDCKMWREHIAPIVGETRVLCYPAGEHNAKSGKNEIFKKYGYDVFLCVGGFGGTDYEKSCESARYIYRKPFDGTALRLYGKQYAHLADTREIYDTRRFRPFSYKGGYR